MLTTSKKQIHKVRATDDYLSRVHTELMMAGVGISEHSLRSFLKIERLDV